MLNKHNNELMSNLDLTFFVKVDTGVKNNQQSFDCPVCVSVTIFQTAVTMLHCGFALFQEAVKQKVANIRGLLTSHHKLMSDVRNILKTMAKVCLCDQPLCNISLSITDFLQSFLTNYQQR